jgi:hypothetical protein
MADDRDKNRHAEDNASDDENFPATAHWVQDFNPLITRICAN